MCFVYLLINTEIHITIHNIECSKKKGTCEWFLYSEGFCPVCEALLHASDIKHGALALRDFDTKRKL